MALTVRRTELLVGLLLVSCLGLSADTGRAAIGRCFGRKPTIVGTEGADRLHGTRGHDVIVGLGGKDLIIGRGDSGDVICGGAGDDDLASAGGTDEVHGGSGDDVIDVGRNLQEGSFDAAVGGAGNDLLSSGAGSDVVFRPGPGRDEMSGSRVSLDYSDAPTRVRVDLRQGIALGHGADRFEGVVEVVGSAHDDVIRGDGSANRLAGGEGNDVLRGREGADVLDAAGVVEVLGNPVEGLPGDDILSGGPGPDRFFGDAGDDRFVGGSGRDTLDLRGSVAPVTVDLAAGFARGDGSDTVVGIESVEGSRFADRLLGDDASNRMLGWYADAEDDDYVAGRGGDDVLLGSRGDDVLIGGSGVDDLAGSFGRDRCIGGEFLTGCEETSGAPGGRGSAFWRLVAYIGAFLGAAAIISALVGRRRLRR